MKKIFLTSGIVLCLACPAFATEGVFDITNDNTNLTNNDPATCEYPTLGAYTGPQTFYAKWTRDHHTVTYAPGGYLIGGTTPSSSPVLMNGATAANQVTEAVYDEAYTILANTAAGLGTATVKVNDTSVQGYPFTKKGYTFNGWVADYNMETGSHVNTNYAGASNQSLNPSYQVAGDVTLTAQWTPDHYDVTYNRGLHAKAGTTDLANYVDENGITFDILYSNLAFDASPISAHMQAADGYTFCGWSTSSSTTCTDPTATNSWKWTGVTFDNSTADANIHDIEVYAIYAPNHYTLTYNCGQPISGSASEARFKGALSTQTHAFDRIYDQNGYTLYTASDVCELDGYHIDTTTPWSCVITGTSTSVDVANVGATWLVANNVTCTANWTRNVIGLSWDVGTGSTANTTDQGGSTCTYDGDIDVAGTPTRTGYTFQGWTTDPASVAGTNYHVFTGNASNPGTSVPAPAQQGGGDNTNSEPGQGE